LLGLAHLLKQVAKGSGEVCRGTEATETKLAKRIR
jgi:hypothetical protein